MMSASRRTFFAFLGLAPAGAAIGSESFREKPESSDCDLQTGRSCTPKSMSEALRRMADGVENGAIEVQSLNFHSELSSREIAAHEMTVKFVYFPEHTS